MRTAYLDCSMGISGDMTVAALVDCGVNVESIRAAVASLGLEGVSLRFEDVLKEGFRAKYLRIEHPPQHVHRTYADIRRILESGDGTLAESTSARRRDLPRRRRC